jgi:hypothetical protein
MIMKAKCDDGNEINNDGGGEMVMMEAKWMMETK